jgi:diacylglycerol kinase family enzyme
VLLNRAAATARRRAAELTVAADRRELDLFVDGEIHRLAPPIRFRTRPGALQVVAPPPRGGMIGR